MTRFVKLEVLLEDYNNNDNGRFLIRSYCTHMTSLQENMKVSTLSFSTTEIEILYILQVLG